MSKTTHTLFARRGFLALWRAARSGRRCRDRGLLLRFIDQLLTTVFSGRHFRLEALIHVHQLLGFLLGKLLGLEITLLVTQAGVSKRSLCSAAHDSKRQMQHHAHTNLGDFRSGLVLGLLEQSSLASFC